MTNSKFKVDLAMKKEVDSSLAYSAHKLMMEANVLENLAFQKKNEAIKTLELFMSQFSPAETDQNDS